MIEIGQTSPLRSGPGTSAYKDQSGREEKPPSRACPRMKIGIGAAALLGRYHRLLLALEPAAPVGNQQYRQRKRHLPLELADREPLSFGERCGRAVRRIKPTIGVLRPGRRRDENWDRRPYGYHAAHSGRSSGATPAVFDPGAARPHRHKKPGRDVEAARRLSRGLRRGRGADILPRATALGARRPIARWCRRRSRGQRRS